LVLNTNSKISNEQKHLVQVRAKRNPREERIGREGGALEGAAFLRAGAFTGFPFLLVIQHEKRITAQHNKRIIVH